MIKLLLALPVIVRRAAPFIKNAVPVAVTMIGGPQALQQISNLLPEAIQDAAKGSIEKTISQSLNPNPAFRNIRLIMFTPFRVVFQGLHGMVKGFFNQNPAEQTNTIAQLVLDAATGQYGVSVGPAFLSFAITIALQAFCSIFVFWLIHKLTSMTINWIFATFGEQYPVFIKLTDDVSKEIKKAEIKPETETPEKSEPTVNPPKKKEPKTITVPLDSPLD